MLNNTLNTNEIKNAAGTEVEFESISVVGRTRTFKQITESPALPNRLTISHQEIGSGLTARRRSVVRFDKTSAGQVDTTANMKASAYIVLDAPVGQMTSTALSADVLAQLMSFVASLGASTTILYDGTGNGAVALIGGGL